MSNVTAIHGGLAPMDPDPELIEFLEGALVDARNGHLRALAYATVRSNGTTGTTGTGWINNGGEWHAVCAGVLSLHWRVGQGTVGD